MSNNKSHVDNYLENYRTCATVKHLTNMVEGHGHKAYMNSVSSYVFNDQTQRNQFFSDTQT